MDEAVSTSGVSVARSRVSEYLGSRFADVWRTVEAEPYRELPQKRLGWRDVLRFLPKSLLHDAERTLRDESDLLPTFDKLVHPVGIALRGVWHITEPTSFTGYFAQGSRALIIARASDALGEHRPGRLRFMGLAGKLYPTLDPEHREPLRTANFFTLENLAGSHSPHFAHSKFVNDLMPPVPHLGALMAGPLGVVAGAAFARADRTFDFTQPAIRQLYPIAELSLTRGKPHAPTFLRLVGDAANPRFDSADLREELANAIHPAGLRFRIEVASEPSRFTPRRYHPIGSILFTEAVASAAVDHRLHFTHPRFRG
jgi:hypothetical protein